MSNQLVKLWERPSRDGNSYTLYLLYVDERGKRRQELLGHADHRKGEQQRARKERELKMGITTPQSLKLSEFIEDSCERSKGQVRASTLREARNAMKDLIEAVGDIDYSNVRLEHGERLVQACRDKANGPATIGKKVRHLKRVFQLAVDRGQLVENPFRLLKQPRYPKQKVRVLSSDECSRLIAAATAHVADCEKQCRTDAMNWPLLVLMALATGKRRGELLNLTWNDVDFEAKPVRVTPKADTAQSWNGISRTPIAGCCRLRMT